MAKRILRRRCCCRRLRACCRRFCRHCSSLASAIVATASPLPQRKYRAAPAVAVAATLPVNTVAPFPFHPYRVSAVATKRSRRHFRHCCCRLACRQRFAVAIPVLLLPLSPTRRRRRKSKPAPPPFLSPQLCLSPPFRHLRSSLISPLPSLLSLTP